MNSKYYAVLKGRTPGIYRSWEETKSQVHGFSGAIYKSFLNETEAKNFMGDDIITENNHINELHIFTDGSHQRETNYLGIGAWCRYLSNEYSLSKTCSQDYLKTYGINDQVSNPTAEFLGVAEVLKQFQGLNNNKPLTLVFNCDYVGPENWISGRWKAKQPYIQKILSNCQSTISSLNCKIKIQHVKAHSGIEGNEKADQLAGIFEEINEFPSLIKLLNH